MLPKCSLDARIIATLREYSANIPSILGAGCGMYGYNCYFTIE